MDEMDIVLLVVLLLVFGLTFEKRNDLHRCNLSIFVTIITIAASLRFPTKDTQVLLKVQSLDEMCCHRYLFLDHSVLDIWCRSWGFNLPEKRVSFDPITKRLCVQANMNRSLYIHTNRLKILFVYIEATSARPSNFCFYIQTWKSE